MTIKSSLMFAKSLIFPKTEKKSSARRSLFGAFICIGLSIVPLVVVLSVASGMIDGMTERIIGLSSNHLQAYVASNILQVKSADSFKKYAEDFKKLEGIKAVYPEIDISALAAANSYRTGAQIRALDSSVFTSNHFFKDLFTVEEGSLDEYSVLSKNASEASSNLKCAVIGQKLSEILSVHPGDTIRIITTKSSDSKISPKLTSFKVCAVISSGYQELDALWVFIPLEAAYEHLSLSNASYTVMIETPDAFSSDLVRMQQDLKKLPGGRYANFYRWDQIHSAEFQNFSSTKVMLVFIMMLIVLVASVNVSSAIVMLVMERRKEIAILKSIGATPKGITLSFLITGMTCGCGGVLVGLPAGILASLNANSILAFLEKLINGIKKIFYIIQGVPASEITSIKLMDPAYYLQNIPVSLPFAQLFLIAASTILLSLIVSIIPSVKAGKEKPLNILRKA